MNGGVAEAVAQKWMAGRNLMLVFATSLRETLHVKGENFVGQRLV